MRRRLATVGAGLVLALAGVLAIGSPAFAHDQLVDSDPADGATVSTLDAVRLTYSESLLGAGDESADLVQVTGADGRHYETACAAVDGPVVTVPVDLGAAGEYTVDWRVVSADGHPVSGSYRFTWSPQSSTDASAGMETSPCAALASSTASNGGLDEQTAGLAAGLSAGAVVIGILVVIVMVGLQARKPKPRRADGDDEAAGGEPDRD